MKPHNHNNLNSAFLKHYRTTSSFFLNRKWQNISAGKLNHKVSGGMKFRYRYLIYFILILILFAENVSISRAQESSFWSEQTRIPEIPDFTQEPPYLIADQNNTIHAFNSQPLRPDDETSLNTIFYRQWTEDGGWTSPIDIFYPDENRSIEILDVTSDPSGIVSLIYQENFGVYFTSTYLSNASKSTEWSPPILIGNKSTGVSVGFKGIGSIGTDGKGNILVVYSGSEFGKGLYYTSSSDSGNTWTDPYPVSLIGDESMVVTDPSLYVGASGKIHAVWATYEPGGAPGPGYYAQFDPETQAWSEPIPMDVPGIRTPSIIEYDDKVIMGYYHANVNGNWWRLSSDGGTTWSVPTQLSPNHVGTNGRVSFAVDSNNILYGFFGERINDLNHGIWQVTWTGFSWTAAEPVVKGPQVVDLSGGGKGFDPRSARAVVSNGNLILVAWTTDGFAGENGAWYSYERVNAPELASVPNIDPEASIPVFSTATASELVALQPTETPIPIITLDDRRQPSQLMLNPLTSVLVGVLLSSIIVIIILTIRLWNQSRNGR
jgi:hypothetical protein